MRVLELTRNMLCQCGHGVLYHHIQLYANCTDLKNCEYGECHCKDFQEQPNDKEVSHE